MSVQATFLKVGQNVYPTNHPDRNYGAMQSGRKQFHTAGRERAPPDEVATKGCVRSRIIEELSLRVREGI
jgi:hypothetical protein